MTITPTEQLASPSESQRTIRRAILKLSIPASLEIVMQTLLGLVDMLFVARLGTYALAGAGLTNQITTLLLLIYGTVGIGASILISQYHGKNDAGSISAIAGQALIFGVGIGILSLVTLLTTATTLLQAMGAEARVVTAGAPFFRIIAFSMPLALLSTIAAAILRAIGNSRTPFIITSAAVIINTLFNYILIFGIGNVIPAFGITGAAYATLFARAIAMTLLFYYLFYLNKSVTFYTSHLFSFCKDKMMEVIKLSYPVACSALIWSGGTFIYMLLFTRLGTDQLVASQIINNIEMLFIMCSFGISVAGLTFVAHEIGTGNFQLMRRKANEIIKAGVVAAIIFGIMMCSVSFLLHFLYPNITLHANNLAQWGLIFYALFQPVKVSNMIMGNGILKGGGITSFVALTDLVVVFILSVPLAYLLGIHWGLGFKGILCARIVEEVARIMVFAVKYRQPKWYRVVV